MFNKGVGSNILSHDVNPSDVGSNIRETGTTKSNITFNAFEAPAKKGFQADKARER